MRHAGRRSKTVGLLVLHDVGCQHISLQITPIQDPRQPAKCFAQPARNVESKTPLVLKYVTSANTAAATATHRSLGLTTMEAARHQANVRPAVRIRTGLRARVSELVGACSQLDNIDKNYVHALEHASLVDSAAAAAVSRLAAELTCMRAASHARLGPCLKAHERRRREMARRRGQQQQVRLLTSQRLHGPRERHHRDGQTAQTAKTAKTESARGHLPIPARIELVLGRGEQFTIVYLSPFDHSAR